VHVVLRVLTTADVKMRTPAMTTMPHAPTAGVGKAPMDEIASGEATLKVNESKSAISRPQERKFLGFSFTEGPEIRRAIAPTSLERFKRRIRDITRRAKGVSMKTIMAELASYMRGWRGYYRFCETPQVLLYLTRWVRLRLSAALWRQWKTSNRRRAALMILGVSQRPAANTAGSGKGPCRLARSKALFIGLSNAHFRSLGLPSLVEEG
jgi:RNA-directed DNA polymerase